MFKDKCFESIDWRYGPVIAGLPFIKVTAPIIA